MSTSIPQDYRDLVDRPVFGHLGTVRTDDTVQVNPMWFDFDGENIRFTHIRSRAKFRNLARNPAMSLSILDPENPYRYLELRGKLIEVIDDPTGAFYQELGARYGNPDTPAPPDAAERIILVMSIERTHTK